MLYIFTEKLINNDLCESNFDADDFHSQWFVVDIILGLCNEFDLVNQIKFL